MRHAIVIGAGFGGLAAALRLRARGLEVTVLDRLDGPGGRAREWRRAIVGAGQVQQQQRYDAGPTVLTAPILFEELFALFGERLDDHVKLLPVTPWYQMQFADGSHFNYGGSTEAIQAEIARFSAADAEQYPAYLAHCKRLFEVGFEQLGDQPFPGPLSMLPVMPAMARLRADRSVFALTARFFKHPNIQRAFSIQPLLVGGNPFNTTSIYSLIHYLERLWGVWFPQGGMAALVRAVVALAERQGVRFIWNATVTAIETHGGPRADLDQLIHPHKPDAVSGVRYTLAGADPAAATSSEHLSAHAVVCNADAGTVLARLLPAAHAKPKVLEKKAYSMGLFVWYFSTKQTYPAVEHHTILFGQTYREVLQAIFNGAQVPDDLSIYLHRPGATDPSYPADGTDSFYALVPVPNNRSGIDWATAGPALRTKLAQVLQARALPGLSDQLIDDFFITPDYFEGALHSPWGAGFSIQPTLMQSAGLRFPNESPRLSGLYFVGAGTHPGAGVPGVLMSAKVMERAAFGSVSR